MGTNINRDRFTRKKSSEWVEWLSDDPLPPKEQEPAKRTVVGRLDPRDRLRQAGMHRSTSLPQAAPPKPTLSIQINVPKFQRPTFKVSSHQVRYWGVFTVLVLSLGVGTRALIELVGGLRDKPRVMGTAVEEKPEYKPVAPEDKQELAKGEEGTVYDPERKLYSYSDSFLGAGIMVSQQPLPDNFKSDPAAFQKVAESIGAKTKVDTAFGPAYIATNTKTGGQIAMLVYKDLLVFLQSTKKFDNDTWKFYVETLRQ